MRNLMNPNKVQTRAIKNGEDETSIKLLADDKVVDQILTYEGDEYHIGVQESLAAEEKKIEESI